MQGSEYFVSLRKSVVLTEKYDVIVNKEELTVTTEYLTLQTTPTCRVDRYRLTEFNFVCNRR